MTVLAAQASGMPATVPPATRRVTSVSAPGPSVTCSAASEPAATVGEASAQATPETRPPPDEVAGPPGTVSAVAAARTHSTRATRMAEL